jgi:hypothetical protein
MNMFKPDKPTISENKKERLVNCVEQLDSSLGKLLDTLENHDFEPDQWEKIDKLFTSCNLRLEDVKEEIKFS